MKHHKNQAGLTWKPRRRGAIYCSPACGANCTHAQYLSVKKHGERMRKMMLRPQDWTVSIHENMRWFVRLRHVRWPSLTVSPGYMGEPDYHCMLSDTPDGPGCESRWFDHKNFVLPQKAVDHRLSLARAHVRNEIKMLAAIESLIQPKQ